MDCARFVTGGSVGVPGGSAGGSVGVSMGVPWGFRGVPWGSGGFRGGFRGGSVDVPICMIDGKTVGFSHISGGTDGGFRVLKRGFCGTPFR